MKQTPAQHPRRAVRVLLLVACLGSRPGLGDCPASADDYDSAFTEATAARDALIAQRDEINAQYWRWYRTTQDAGLDCAEFDAAYPAIEAALEGFDLAWLQRRVEELADCVRTHTERLKALPPNRQIDASLAALRGHRRKVDDLRVGADELTKKRARLIQGFTEQFQETCGVLSAPVP